MLPLFLQRPLLAVSCRSDSRFSTVCPPCHFFIRKRSEHDHVIDARQRQPLGISDTATRVRCAMAISRAKSPFRVSLAKLLTKSFLTAVLVTLSACAASPPLMPLDEGARAHYRSSERFATVIVDISAIDGALESSLIDSVAAELVAYLGRAGVEAIRVGDLHQGDDARLEVRFSRSHPSQAFLYWTYFVHARLFNGNGKLVDEATIYHDASLSKAAATAQQLAALVADDMLLIWHPAAAANKESGHAGPARYTILPGEIALIDHDGKARASWETFPTERLLEFGDLTAKDITDVRYELRLRTIPKTTSEPTGNLKPVYKATGLNEATYVIPFKLPTCGEFVWAVRARFKLLGHPRVTEWSGRSYQRRMMSGETGSPSKSRESLDHFGGAGIYVFVPPPANIECGELLGGTWTRSWGPISLLYDAKKIDTSGLRIDRLQEGQSIAAIATVSSLCKESDCNLRNRDKEASEMLRSSLAYAFDKRSLAVSVRDMSELSARLPVPPEPGLQRITGAQLLSYVRMPRNIDYLLASGIRYVVSTELSTTIGAAKKKGIFASGDGGMPVIGIDSSRPVTSIANSDVIDVISGEVIGSIKSDAEAVRGWVGLILPFPIMLPHGYLSDSEAKACQELARRLAFAFTVGKETTQWPEEYFEDIRAPMWEPHVRDL